jgi:hypothetical protein
MTRPNIVNMSEPNMVFCASDDAQKTISKGSTRHAVDAWFGVHIHIKENALETKK